MCLFLEPQRITSMEREAIMAIIHVHGESGKVVSLRSDNIYPN